MSTLTAGSAIESTPAEPAPVRRAAKGPDAAGWYWGTGRRKTAIARVRVKAGSGRFMVKAKPMDEFFAELRDRNDINAVLEKTGTLGKLDIHAGVLGGGFTGQAGAIVLGLGRALLNYDPSLEPILRENGFLTRDSRKVERKKYGQAGARRRFQFSKR
jgi:small subunit ribosomal protein S9